MEILIYKFPIYISPASNIFRNPRLRGTTRSRARHSEIAAASDDEDRSEYRQSFQHDLKERIQGVPYVVKSGTIIYPSQEASPDKNEEGFA